MESCIAEEEGKQIKNRDGSAIGFCLLVFFPFYFFVFCFFPFLRHGNRCKRREGLFGGLIGLGLGTMG